MVGLGCSDHGARRAPLGRGKAAAWLATRPRTCTASNNETGYGDRSRVDVSDDKLAQLYRTYAPVIYARCRRILNDARAAEDATQETFLRVHRHLAKAPDPQHALRWIYRIATNYCLNELRDRIARPTPVDDVDARSGGQEADMLDEVIDRDLVVRLLARVHAQVGQVAWLHHVDGLDQNEVAQLLGISRRTVVNRLAEVKRIAHLYLRRTAV